LAFEAQYLELEFDCIWEGRALCKEQQHSQKTGIFRDEGVAEAPPGFQAGWSDCVYVFFSLFLFILFAHLEFSCKFLYS
jgi:hypothetical protein